MCTMVASWSLTQDIAGLSPFTVITIFFVTEIAEFSETFSKNYCKNAVEFMIIFELSLQIH